MNFDEQVSSFITKLLADEGPGQRSVQQEVYLVYKAGVYQNATHTNLKQKYYDLREKSEFQMQYIANLTAEISDARARLKLQAEQHATEVDMLKTGFAVNLRQLQDKLGGKIESLLQQNQGLAKSNEVIAAQFHEAKSQLQADSQRVISRLQNELDGYKTKFDAKLAVERYKLQQQIKYQEDYRLAAILKQKERLLDEQIQIQMDKLYLAKSNEIEQLKIEAQKNALALQQQYYQQLRDEIEKERRALVQQQLQENQTLIEQGKQAAQRQMEDVENAAKRQIARLRAEHDEAITAIARQHESKMNAYTQRSEAENTALRNKLKEYENAAAKLIDEFTMAKAMLERKYASEVQQLRTNYRELAANLYNNEKGKINSAAYYEMRRQLYELAVDVYRRLEADFAKERGKIQLEVVELRAALQYTETERKEANQRLQECVYKLDNAKRAAGKDATVLYQLEDEKQAQMLVYREMSRAYEETRYMHAEHLCSLNLAYYRAKASREAQLLEGVKTQIAAIVAEKDYKNAELRQVISSLENQVGHYYEIIRDLESV